ncbi:dihydroneopterin aldolase [Tumebacillus algifaecis]|uniref:7,8-dihydroneopterin aldolase n=1 Tax=Tumebacillus algifaecis TaxID=1214604 RepID=A0A223D6A7_9BACL|nr:dihydroneopterin aldolase [Tumebacillus algifaecis]ASS76973.1 dihydroneopterin aldolase [Tumebacillus algifaecis]
MDAIYISGMEFYGYHGVLEEENRLGQRFYADLVLYTSLQEAGESDDLTKTVNYAEAYEEIRQIMDGEPVQLIETLAERIAKQMLTSFLRVQKVQVKVTKPMPPIAGLLSGVAVEVIRER